MGANCITGRGVAREGDIQLKTLLSGAPKSRRVPSPHKIITWETVFQPTFPSIFSKYNLDSTK